MKIPINAIILQCTTLCLVLLTSAAFCRAEDFHNALSLQGYTGLLNIPNAGSTDEGKFYALYSDQIEDQWRGLTRREENYLFSVGLFSFMELGGRVSDAPGAGVRDLSGNIKITIPFIPKGYGLPDIAIGIQDMGGGSSYLQTRYAVATEEWWMLRLSLGYGTGPDRMNGMFGGAELKILDWLYLIGENDTEETNVGARIVTSSVFGFPINLQATAKTSLDYRPGHMEFGFGLQFPLGDDRWNRAPLPDSGREQTSPPHGPQTAIGSDRRMDSAEPGREYYPGAIEMKGSPAIPGKDGGGLTLLLKKLADDGFQNIRVGTREESLLLVEYENNRYNHNELDGLGVVIGLVVDTVPRGYETLRLVLKNQDIRIMELSAPLELFRAFLHDPEKYRELNEKLAITADIQDDNGVVFATGPRNPTFLTSSLVVYPGLKTFVATEVGAFDYLLSVKLDYFLNAWKGAVVNARWDVPVSWSENFDDDKAYRDSREDSRLERLALFQVLKVAPQVMVNVGGGMILHDAYGTLNEVMWTLGDGTHRLAFKQAYVSRSDGQGSRQRNEVYLGSYRYFVSSLDLSLEGTGGKFYDNDTGFRLEMKRFFGDTSFSVYYADTRNSLHEDVRIGGVMIAFPLTPRRDMKPGVAQLKGSDEWSYSQETRIVKVGETNTVPTSIGVDPTPPYNLERVFFNRDRLSEPYLRKHLFRLRDAYMINLTGERR